MSRIHRRQFLKGMAASLLLDPILRISRAEAAAAPTRAIWFHSPLGTTREEFLSRSNLASLAPHRSDLLFVDGMNVQYRAGVHREAGILLTGERCDGYKEGSLHTNISVDQVIANRLKGVTKIPSLSLAVWDNRGVRFDADRILLSAAGPRQGIVPEGNPQAAFDRVFGNLASPQPTTPAGNAQLEWIRERQKSVLDGVIKEIASLQKNYLSGLEREKLEIHTDAIRQLELRLRTLPPDTSGGTNSACVSPRRPAAVTGRYTDVTIPARMNAMIDIVTTAMACDLTRVAVLFNGREFVPSWLGLNGQFHASYSHGTGTYPQAALISKWYAEQFGYLVGRLKALGILSQTAAVWFSEQGCRGGGGPAEHSSVNLPIVIAGSGGGYFRTGRSTSVQGSFRQFNINMMNAMGVAGNTYGTVTDTPLSNLT